MRSRSIVAPLGPGGKLGGDRQRKCKWAHVGERRRDVAGIDERSRVRVHRLAAGDAGRHRLHPDRPVSRADQRAQQCRCDDGLADAGVGAGDEDAAGHFMRGGPHRAGASRARSSDAVTPKRDYGCFAGGGAAAAGPKNVLRVKNV